MRYEVSIPNENGRDGYLYDYFINRQIEWKYIGTQWSSLTYRYYDVYHVDTTDEDYTMMKILYSEIKLYEI